LRSGRELPVAERAARNREDVAAATGRRTRIVGEYVEVDMRRMPTGRPEYLGRAGIMLDDGTRVLLEPGWSQDGLRSAEERRRFAGKRVEAIGALWSRPPPPPEPIAYPLSPCLAQVESVKEVV
jgi:hypothetical protein